MSIRGALLTNSVDLTTINPTGGLLGSYNTTVYDTDSIVSGSHFVIPSALNGKYGVITHTVDMSLQTGTDSTQLWIAKDNGGSLFSGVTWAGVPTQAHQLAGNGQSTTSNWAWIATGIIPLVTGARYDVTWQTISDTSITLGKSGCFGLYVLDTYLWGYAVAKLSGDLTGQNFSTPTAIAWDGTDVLDTMGAHSPSVNNTKFVVTAAMSGHYFVVGASVHLGSVASGNAASLAIRKNGSFVYTGMAGTSGVTTNLGYHTMTCATQAIQVSEGDEFEAVLYCGDTSTDLTAARSNMYVMVVG